MARRSFFTVALLLSACRPSAEPPQRPTTDDVAPVRPERRPSPPKASWLGDYAAARVLLEQARLAQGADEPLRAAQLYEQAGHHGQHLPSQSWRSTAVSAAEQYVLAGRHDDALDQLEAVVAGGYRSARALETFVGFEPIRDDPRFERVVSQARDNFERYRDEHADPENATLEFSDVPRFWTAFDRASGLRENGQWAAVFREAYFEPATAGLADYLWLKTTSAELLVQMVRRAEPYYAGIRQRTLQVADYEPEIRSGFRKLAQIYPDAHFPPTTFVIGRLNSGGTAGEEGMLIGLDIWAYTEGGSLEGVPSGMKLILERMRMEQLPLIVLHEQIHAMQQYGGEESLLRDILMEGSADFIASLALPDQPHMPYYTWGLANEQRVWERFEPQMHDGRYGDWMANYNRPQLEEDWHPDLGYFVGARICEAYYAQAADKQQAIVDLLFVTDPFAILRESGYPTHASAPS